MAGLASSGFWKFAPLAAIGGAALAVASWTLPIPGLAVAPGDATTIDPGPDVQPRNPSDMLPPIPRHDWELLVVPLKGVRAEVPEAVTLPEGAPPPPPPSVGTLANWRFVGAVSEPGGMVAIVSVDDRQRYFSVGQVITVRDDGTTAEIISVHEDHVVVRVEGVDERVTMQGPKPGTASRPNTNNAGNNLRGRSPIIPRGRSTPPPGRS